MKPTDKIEVEAGDLRNALYYAKKDGGLNGTFFAERLLTKYPAAFAPDEEWEDVTDALVRGMPDGFWGVFAQCVDVLLKGQYKIENNRIWRRKS